MAVLFASLMALMTQPAAAETDSAAVVQQLIEDLSSDDESIQIDAAEKLGELGPKAAAAVPILEAVEESAALVGAAMIARRKIGPGPEPFFHSVHHTEIESGGGDLPHWQYVLHVDETGQEFPLGRMYVLDSKYTPGLGFDKESLLISWLEPNRLLHFYWTTHKQGNGSYMAQGNILLYKDRGRWEQVFRDCRPYYSSGGGGNSSRTEIEFKWTPASQKLTLIERDSTSSFVNTRSILSKPVETDNSGTMYYSRFSFIREWKGTIQNGTIEFQPGTEYLQIDLEDADFIVGDVAQFLARATEWGRQSSAMEHLNHLLYLNDGLTPSRTCPQRVVCRKDVPPFEASPVDIYHTGK